MQENTAMTAARALYWVAFRQDKSHEAIIAEADELREQHILHDRLVRLYLCHKTKGTAWPPTFYSPKEWEEIRNITKVQNIPKMLAAYCKKNGGDWQAVRRLCSKVLCCARVIQKAERELLVAARKQQITLSGIPRSRDGEILGDRTEIPYATFAADDWAFKPYNDQLQRGKFSHERKSRVPLTCFWSDLRIEPSRIKHMWPNYKGWQTKKPPPASVDEIVRCMVVLIKQKHHNTMPSRDACHEGATTYFERLERKAPYRAVDEAIKKIRADHAAHGIKIRNRGGQARNWQDSAD